MAQQQDKRADKGGRRHGRGLISVRAVLLSAALVLSGTGASLAQVRPENGGLPIPRFVSLRSGEVNLRTGPGGQYPIEWVFLRANMPVEVIAEYETWRRIRDADGAEGWVHQRLLSGRRTALITGAIRDLRRRPEGNSPLVARLEPGVIAEIRTCKGDWCQLDIGGKRGWVLRGEFWGTYPNEPVEG